MKIHIERDFNFIELELEDKVGFDHSKTDNLRVELQRLYNLLPGKLATENKKAVSELKAAGKPPRTTPKATANQIRLLERNGYDATNMTAADASALLTELGY